MTVVVIIFCVICLAGSILVMNQADKQLKEAKEALERGREHLEDAIAQFDRAIEVRKEAKRLLDEVTDIVEKQKELTSNE